MALIEMREIVKVYPNGVTANDGVNFTIEHGEIHALVGENGAGKTTLMKILFGLEQPDGGQVLLNEKEIRFHSAQDAIRAGIGMVHQNFMLIPSFTVAENVVLGQEPRRGRLTDSRRAVEITRDLAEEYGLRVEPEAVVESINVGMRQRVEILKTLYRGAEILILDEPTAVLTPQETQDLFRAARALAQQGKTLIFITHKLREVKEISDRVTVMRGGKVIGTLATKDTTRESLARMMVGRDVFLDIHKPPQTPGERVMEVHDLSVLSETGRRVLKDVSFDVRSGEILGVAGVEGNGQTELVEALTGLRPAAAGHAYVNGRDVLNRTPRQARSAGIAHIPEDRLTNGLAQNASIAENLIVDRYDHPPYRKGIFIDRRQVDRLGAEVIATYDIRTPDANLPVASLSGGNMQKVIIGREFSASPRLLIAAQPTRGVDVGATEFIREQLLHKRGEGAGILLVSADLSEVMSLADRIIVLFEGCITGVFPCTEDVSEEELGYYMLGVKKQTNQEMEPFL